MVLDTHVGISELTDKLRPNCATLLADTNLHPGPVISPTGVRFLSAQPPKRLSSHTPPDFPRSAALGKRHWCSFETSTVLVESWATQKSWARIFFVAKDVFFEKARAWGDDSASFWKNVLGKKFQPKQKMVVDSKWCFFSQKSALFPSFPFLLKIDTCDQNHPLVASLKKPTNNPNQPTRPVTTTTTTFKTRWDSPTTPAVSSTNRSLLRNSLPDYLPAGTLSRQLEGTLSAAQQKSGDHQLRLVVYPIINKGFIHVRWCRISSFNSMKWYVPTTRRAARLPITGVKWPYAWATRLISPL